MEIFKLKITAICSALFLLTCTVAAGDVEFRQRSSEYANRGVEAFDQGEMPESISLFSQALIYDFENSQANQYFKKLTQDARIAEREKRQLERSLELVDYIKFLKKRTQDLKKKNARLREFIHQYGKDYQVLTKSIEILGSDRFSAKMIDKLYSQYVNEQADIDKKGIRDLTRMLSKVKGLHVESMESTQAANDQLKKIKKKLIQATKQKRPDDTKKVFIKDEDISDRERSEADKLEEDLASFNSALTVLKKDVLKSEDRINKLTEELTTKSLELFEKENLILSQRKDYEDLQVEFDDARQRLQLVQRIMQEKDETISQLEEHIEKVKEESNEKRKVSQEYLQSLEATLGVLQGKLDAQKQLSAEKMQSLESLIAEQERAIASQTNNIKQKEESIEDLQSQILTQSKELARMKEVVQSKDEKLVELDGIVEIYKGKLADAYKDRSIKRYNVKRLKGKIGQLERDLDASHRSTRELYEKIMKLESHFSRIREKNLIKSQEY